MGFRDLLQQRGMRVEELLAQHDSPTPQPPEFAGTGPFSPEPAAPSEPMPWGVQSTYLIPPAATRRQDGA